MCLVLCLHRNILIFLIVDMLPPFNARSSVFYYFAGKVILCPDFLCISLFLTWSYFFHKYVIPINRVEAYTLWLKHALSLSVTKYRSLTDNKYKNNENDIFHLSYQLRPFCIHMKDYFQDMSRLTIIRHHFYRKQICLFPYYIWTFQKSRSIVQRK